MIASQRIVVPHAGKTEIALNRMRNAAGIFSRNGASSVWIARVQAGFDAGSFHLYNLFESLSHTAEVAVALETDPAWQALSMEIDAGPASDDRGPSIWRRVYGDTDDENDDAVMQRSYVMPQSNIASALELIPEIQKLLVDYNVRTQVWMPVVAADMTRIMVTYSSHDTATLATFMEDVGTSSAFHEILSKASTLGTLDRSSILVTQR